MKKIKACKTTETEEVKQNCEQCEETMVLDDNMLPFLFGQQQQQHSKSLEDQGIFFINQDISKQSLSRVMKSLLELHYNPEFKEDVHLYINSPGGDLDATWALIDVMKSVRFNIRTIAVGEIASAATMIFITGDIRIMGPNSGAMIHQYSMGTMGNYSELVAMRKWQDDETKKMIRHFIQHSKFKTEKEIKDNILLENDNYLTPKEMKNFGLCDEISTYQKKKKK